MDELHDFGRLIRERRISLGISQEALAAEAFNNADRKGFISQIENGRRPSLAPATIISLARALNIQEHELPKGLRRARNEAVHAPSYPSHVEDEAIFPHVTSIEFGDLLEDLHAIALDTVQSFVATCDMTSYQQPRETLERRLVTMDAIKVMRLLWRDSQDERLASKQTSKNDIVNRILPVELSMRALDRKRVAISRILDALVAFRLVHIQKPAANRTVITSTTDLDLLMEEMHTRLALRTREVLSGDEEPSAFKRLMSAVTFKK